MPTLHHHDAYLAARRHTRADVLAKPPPVPAAAGVYGWWFREIPATLNTDRCERRNGLTLLYTGISPSKPPSNGKAPSTQNIRKRIRYHYTGNAYGSTLRLTLGCLLSDQLGIQLRRYGSGNRRHFGHAEAVLDAWMADNALVSWITHPEPWIAEDQLIKHLDVPLNLVGNKRNEFHPHLTAARQTAANRANELPVLPNPGPRRVLR